MERLPRLFYKAKTGAMHQWNVFSVGARICTQHGQVGGKIQESCKIAEAKNVGRANYTSDVEQADIEAKALWAHKLKRKYSLTPEAAQQILFLPMLAQDFKKHHHGISYPVLVQPKLDGFRCLASKENGVVTLYSRSGDTFDLPHITKELDALPDDTVVDGELYCHGIPFQTVASWIKKQRPESLQIGYHIYDVPEAKGNMEMMMFQRVKILEFMAQFVWEKIDIVHTDSAASREEVLALQQRYVESGYEGAIVRISNAKYQYGYRSYGLLKVKDFEDAEFEVVGGHAGVGKMNNQCIFECVTEKGLPFNVVPIGTAAERRAYLVNLNDYMYAKLTVKFQGRSIEGVPRFPIGKGFRPGKDLSKKGKKQ